MTKTEQEQALAKARKSVAEHMDKMKKAVSDHMDKMVKLHKAHADEMEGHFGKLHKILGTEPESVDPKAQKVTKILGTEEAEAVLGNGDEPKPVDPEEEAAPNTRHVSGPSMSGKADNNAELMKAVKDLTKTVADMQKNFDQQLEKGINDGLQMLLGDLTKAEDDNECPECNGTGKKDGEKCQHCMGKGKKAQKAAPTAGIGDRNDPVLFKSGPAIRVMPVTKTQDYSNPGNPPQPQQVPSPDDVLKASRGDQAAVLRVMKGASVISGLPETLAKSGVLQK